MNDVNDDNGPSATVLKIITPPWFVPYDRSKPQYGSIRELESKRAAKHEESRANYKIKYPELYAEWANKLAKHKVDCEAIFNAPNENSTRAATIAATNGVSPKLAERIKGADKQVVTEARRTATIAMTASIEAERLTDVASNGDDVARKNAADAAKRAADAGVRAIQAAKRAMLLFKTD